MTSAITDPEIERVFVCSTAHITLTDSTILADEGCPQACWPYEYGYYVWVGGAGDLADNEPYLLEAGFSPEFLRLLHLTREHNCTWLRLDCDGSVYDDLTVFDW